MELKSVGSAPRDGRQFLVFDPKSKRFAVANWPFGHALGNWERGRTPQLARSWFGKSMDYPSRYTLWAPLPDIKDLKYE